MEVQKLFILSKMTSRRAKFLFWSVLIILCCFVWLIGGYSAISGGVGPTCVQMKFGSEYPRISELVKIFAAKEAMMPIASGPVDRYGGGDNYIRLDRALGDESNLHICSVSSDLGAWISLVNRFGDSLGKVAGPRLIILQRGDQFRCDRSCSFQACSNPCSFGVELPLDYSKIERSMKAGATVR